MHSPLLVLAFACRSFPIAAVDRAPVQEWTFGWLDGIRVTNRGRAEVVTYSGRRAVHLIVSPDHAAATDNIAATLADSDFADGTIEADVAGASRAGAPGDSRGFIGVALRVQPAGRRYENFCVRPTNGRAGDPLHSSTDAYFSRLIISQPLAEAP